MLDVVEPQAVGETLAIEKKSIDEVLEQFDSPFQVSCPHCQTVGVVDESARGQKMRCPECLWLFIGLPKEDSVPGEKAEEVEEVEEGREAVEKNSTQAAPPVDEQIFPESEEIEEEQDRGVFFQDDEPVPALDFEMSSGEAVDELTEEVVQETVVESVSSSVFAKVEDVTKIDLDEKSFVPDEPEIVTETAALADTSFAEIGNMPKFDVSDPEGRTSEVGIAKQETVDKIEEQTAEEKPLLKQPAEDLAIKRGSADEKGSAGVSEETVPETTREIEFDNVDLEPSGETEKECWQCGKRGRNVDFSSVYDRLYCSDCFLDDEFSILQPVFSEKPVPSEEETEDRVAAVVLRDEEELPAESAGVFGRIRKFFR